MFGAIFKSFCIAFVLLGGGIYFFYLNSGSFPNLSLPLRSNQADVPTESIIEANFSSLEQPDLPLYKWRLNGRWHYGLTPPSGVDAEQVRLVKK